MLGGSPDTVHRFWDKMDKHPSYASHPMHRHALSSFKTHGVPLRIHGDETPVTGVGKTWSKLVDATSWSSCLVNHGQARRNNFLMGYVFSDLLFEEDGKQISEETLWRHLTWSLFWLYQGVWPNAGPNGERLHGTAKKIAGEFLADGFFGICWALLGDLDHCTKRWRFADYNSAKPCSLCRADNALMP